MAECTSCIPNKAANAQGTIFEIKDPETDAFIAVCGINSISMNGMTRAELDITTLCSTMKESAPDLPDPGSLEIAGFLLPGDESQVVMRALFLSGETTEWRITSPVEGYTQPFKMEGLGWVSGMPVNFASGSIKSISFPVRLTGQVVFTDPTNTPTP